MDDIVYSTETNRYNLYEKAERSRFERRSIDGTIVGCSKCCGYCQYEEHPGFLTEKQIKEHSCINKQCYHFIKKPIYEKKLKHPKSPLLLDYIQKSLSDIEGVKVLRIKNNSDDCEACFVAITNNYNFDDCISDVKNKFNISLTFVKLNYDFDICAKLIYAN